MKKEPDKSIVTDKNHHILQSSSNLLGICFLIITSFKITNTNDNTFADEICLFTAFALLISCLLSYLSIRKENNKIQYEILADLCYLAALAGLFSAMFLLVIGW